jgi:tetratricopeptide (TPR) repeat protein
LSAARLERYYRRTMSMIDRSSRPVRLGGAALIVFLALGLAGCSKSQAQLASDALDAGLQAQTAGHLDEAITDYTECLKHDSLNKLCLYDLGTVYQAQGNLAQAEQEYRLTLLADAKYAPALFNLATVLTKTGGTNEAISLYRQFLEIRPDDASGHLNLGLLLQATGDMAGGQAQIDRALAIDPTLASRLPSASPEVPSPATPSPSPSPSLSKSPSASPKPSAG